MKYSGTGTQKAEEDLSKLFPEARILRMDADTVAEKGSRDEILSQVSRGECDILLGTQMITKGLDFPNVTLVGVLNADTMLFSSDFRALEKTFSLMTQVVGRAGRSEKSGRAIIQSYYPEHRVFRYALDQDYVGFYKDETAFRRMMLYPPFCDICQISFIAKTEEDAFDAAERFEQLYRGEIKKIYEDVDEKHIALVVRKMIQEDGTILGITKVALNSESFMAASSFQLTEKGLKEAALFGKKDEFNGITENVIPGLKIPAGTGMNGIDYFGEEAFK